MVKREKVSGRGTRYGIVGANGSRPMDFVIPNVLDTRARLAKLQRHRETYIRYARERIDSCDWRGASDAANDLRELDVEIRMLKERHGI